MTPEQRERRNAKQREYYARNREAETAKQRERRKDPKVDARRRELRAERYWTDPEARREEAKAWYAANRERSKALSREYRAKNKDEIRFRKRKAAYGITREQFEALWNAQGGRCATCLDVLVEDGRRTHVDHCHVTGKVRGLLCVDCNVGLGRFKDRADVLERAASYVRQRSRPGAV